MMVGRASFHPLRSTWTSSTCSSRDGGSCSHGSSQRAEGAQRGMELEGSAAPNSTFDSRSRAVQRRSCRSTWTSPQYGAVSVVAGIEEGNRLPRSPRSVSASALSASNGGRCAWLPDRGISSRCFPPDADRRPRRRYPARSPALVRANTTASPLRRLPFTFAPSCRPRHSHLRVRAEGPLEWLCSPITAGRARFPALIVSVDFVLASGI